MNKKLDLQQRPAPQPETTKPRRGEPPTPHSQVSQNAPPELQEALFERIRALPGVSVGKSLVSVPGARAFHLDEALARGPKDAFQRGREFAHIHPAHDGSLHVALPRDVYDEVLAQGWGEPHPISGTMMVFGPRDANELEIVFGIVKASYDYAASGSAKEAGELG
jgi:phospholipase/carboxylesterase